ncbi:NAD(P)H-dependent oxidoreductase [Methanoplanus sp. FWC-SCC4]|uniref:NAD(P)H-dependent oxidoreductase n=1 Tax=Methanochimaera problematica TaxID=2609417 RepID=A0AA97I4Q2_9EURY|nr:NAD(P)H-dependent oxidoreductase [Methanoplanus sp. FWC-SCC4]WOF16739.1 NAD(P)H-dependent oxidoreductase [Methanoplanus sp. FWC-SCC4]
MNVLIIYAHPEPKSLNGTLKNKAVEVLSKEGHNVKVSDLYAMKFKAALDGDDFTDRVDKDKLVIPKEQMHAYDNGTLRSDIEEETEKVKWADLLIFQFPLWWSSCPAIMKGWIERVFLQGFVVNLYDNKLYDTGHLAGKKALISSTVGSSEELYTRYGLHGDLDVHLMTLWHATFEFTGMEVLDHFLVYKASVMNEERVKSELERFETYLKAL